MTDRNRERKVSAAVACPSCGAQIGQACRFVGGRPMTCTDRRSAWRAWSASRPPDFVLRSWKADRSTLVCPQTAEARAWLAARYALDEMGSARIPYDDMPTVTASIIDAGWKTADGV